MKRLFNPGSIVVIGASATKGKAGYNVMWNLRNTTLTRGLYPINPNRREIMGHDVFSSIDALPESAFPIDLAIICLPPDAIKETINECINKRVNFIIIETGQLAGSK
ncbi:MAG: CoA-binding protein, partial [Promethearchaeota archaeon]